MEVILVFIIILYIGYLLLEGRIPIPGGCLGGCLWIIVATLAYAVFMLYQLINIII